MIDFRGYFLGYKYNDDLNRLVQRWRAVAVPLGFVALMVATVWLARKLP